MDDLDELKGRVERATRVLSEREAEEQGRHSKLVSLVAALESKSLEARREKEEAEARLTAVEAENAELRGLLSGLLSAVEAGSRSRFADALYALEARVSGLSPAVGGPASDGPASDGPASDGPASDGPAPDGGEEAAPAPSGDPRETQAEAPEADRRAEAPNPDAAGLLAGEGGEALDDFTARLAAGCAVEDELAREAEVLRAEAADDAKALLARIRQQVEAPDGELDPESGQEALPDPEAGEPLDEALLDEIAVDEAAADEAAAAAALAEGLDEEEGRPPAEQPAAAAESAPVDDAAAEGAPVEDAAGGDEPAGGASSEERPTGDAAAPDDVPDDEAAAEDEDWRGKRQAAS